MKIFLLDPKRLRDFGAHDIRINLSVKTYSKHIPG